MVIGLACLFGVSAAGGSRARPTRGMGGYRPPGATRPMTTGGPTAVALKHSAARADLRMSIVSCFSLDEAHLEADVEPRSLRLVGNKSSRDVYVVWRLVVDQPKGGQNRTGATEALFGWRGWADSNRSYLRITEQEFVSLPVDILVQGIISLFLTMYGLMSISGEFKEIRATVDLETKSWETLRNIPSFYVFSHRGRALSPNYVPPLQKAILEEMDS
uniref:(California timema) hypothetical protein n=1 Tax=Timema californicum TaxID=61474 RepID=A0A7R9J2J5_TIMCA|nr:unnamed protein product [Timema californicum]